MKNEDVENILSHMRLPEPEKIVQPHELKIPFLGYKKSSKAGLWLLVLPLTFAVTVFLKTELGVQSKYFDGLRKFFGGIDNHSVLTYLIPVIFAGLPLIAMIINLLAICHFEKNDKTKELIITIKYRPLNIAIFLLSFAVLAFFLLPDKLSF